MPTASAEGAGIGPEGGVGEVAARRVFWVAFGSTRVLGVRRRHAPRFEKKQLMGRTCPDSHGGRVLMA